MIDTNLKKPNVKLIGSDGNAFALMASCKKVFVKNKAFYEEQNVSWDQIAKEMMQGDYNNLLSVINNYFEIG